MSFDELKQEILKRGSELIAQGVSTDQLGYLMKGLEILENIRQKDAVADAISQIGDVQAKLVEAKNLLNEALTTKAITELGKPAARLFGRVMSYWGKELPLCPPTGDNAAFFTYTNLDKVKEEFVKKTATVLEFCPRNVFHFQQQIASYGNNEPYLWAMYLLKNNTDQEKKIEITGKLSSRTNGLSGAYIVANGTVVLSYTSNAIADINLSQDNAITIPPNSGMLIFVQHTAYYHNYNNSFYLFRFVHNLDFNLPDGVDWDYEAYKQLLS
jgi:hypothetical protein